MTCVDVEKAAVVPRERLVRVIVISEAYVHSCPMYKILHSLLTGELKVVMGN